MISQKRFCDAVNPPLPISSTSSFDAISGQRLLSLLKSYDKYKQQQLQQNLNEAGETNSDDHFDASKIGATVEEIINMLQQLTIVVQRQGLLRRNSNNSSNATMAKHVLDSMSTAKQQHNTSNSGKKKRKVNHQPTLLDDTIRVDGISSNTSTTTTADVQLLMMSILRIVENYHDNDVYRWIYTTTTDLITASCQYNIIQQQSMNPNSQVDLCFLAEYELIASSCKSLLCGIEQCIRRILSGRNSATTIKVIEPQQSEQDYAMNEYSIVSSFRAVTSMIGLLGHKLFTTRNNSSTNAITTTLHKLQELAWQTLLQVPQQPLHQPCSTTTGSVSILQAQKAAITFLTIIPYASAMAAAATNTNLDNNTHNRVNSSMSWNQTWVDVVSALSYTIQQLPIEKSSSDNKKESMDDASIGNMSDSIKQMFLHQWVTSLQSKNNTDEDARVNHLLQNIQSLVTMLMTLLTRESVPSLSSGNINCEIDIDKLLTIIDTMISVPSLAETKYYSTKKRLRNESMTTGSGSFFAFSPLCIVTKMALPIRLIGYELFHTTITSLGSMNLLPFVRRIIKISYQTVLSSASNTVRYATDPATMMFGWNNNNSNKRGERWLHTSIISRTASIRSFQCCIQTFGIDLQQLSLSTNMNRNTNGNRNSHVESSIRIICATMIEELSLKNSIENIEADNDWGTWDDRLKLVCTIATCLTTCLNCGGSFLSPTFRDPIDTVAATSLSLIVHAHPIMTFGEIKCSILQLGVAVLCTPWQDGASSTIATAFLSAAQSCVQDSNEEVVATAVASLNVCNALHCSRLPPLHIITRPNNFLGDYASSSTAITAENIEDKLRSTREEMNRAKAMSDEKAKVSALKKAKSDLTNQTQLKIASTVLAAGNSIAIQQLSVVDDAKLSLGDVLKEKKDPQEQIIAMPEDPVVAKENESSLLLLDPTLNTDVDEDFPMIVDCGPDEDDE